MKNVSTFVLVHGAWHGGWCWQRVAPLLRAAGHDVHAPSLTGLGDRAHLANRAIDLETHIADICALLEMENLGDVVLVGHSYAGMVIAGVADRAAARLKRLVYVDAFVPEQGKCLLDYWPAETRADVETRAAATGFVPPTPLPAYGVQFSRRLSHDPAWTYREIAAGHDCMIADPHGTAELLLSLA
jgi:pimeloyl-ACP methyl ester carboxylesterase